MRLLQILLEVFGELPLPFTSNFSGVRQTILPFFLKELIGAIRIQIGHEMGVQLWAILEIGGVRIQLGPSQMSLVPLLHYPPGV